MGQKKGEAQNNLFQHFHSEPFVDSHHEPFLTRDFQMGGTEGERGGGVRQVQRQGGAHNIY